MKGRTTFDVDMLKLYCLFDQEGVIPHREALASLVSRKLRCTPQSYTTIALGSVSQALTVLYSAGRAAYPISRAQKRIQMTP